MKKIKDAQTQIFIGEDVLLHIDKYLSGLSAGTGASVVVVADKNSMQYTMPLLPFLSGFEMISIDGSERSKNIDTAVFLWKEFERLQLDRNAVVVCVGGGVISDIAGFAAATYKRGIKFINIPTTLLAMVDASVGGKTAIDLDGIKNIVGVFARPVAVFIYPPFIKTLPHKQILSGIAEIIKMYAIRKRNFSIDNFDISSDDFTKHIFFAIHEKARIVSRDFKESGLRKTLNFGHTVGHAIEAFLLSQGRNATHGECVMWGMAAELSLSVQLLGFPQKEYEKFLSFATLHYPPLNINEQDIPTIINYMRSDKKNTNCKITPVLLRRYGCPVSITAGYESLISVIADLIK
ncbi:MAG: 3-dehydroquinate synthase [Bacteroidales bacterium]|jgi:3-dehydroquinate synthase|nr:3-dehydroquinate synthase [Bacteroidales bacterium]